MSELVSQPTSIQSVYSWYRSDKLLVNRRYQRKLVWTLEEKQRLIESILKRYPIPALLVAERKDQQGTYEIIDGLQRLHAIVSFLETAFPTLDDRTFDIQLFPTAQGYADDGQFEKQSASGLLSRTEVTSVLDYTLGMSVMRNATDEEIDDVFGRINTYGHRLSDQERRQAGVKNDFSELVRTIASTIRRDATADVMPLKLMPSISIDLPKTSHGYDIKADEVFWVQQGILRSTDLRDSMDEQCIADTAACIVGGTLIERSKEALDRIYDSSDEECTRIQSALEVYGAGRFAEEFKYCVDQILAVCNDGSAAKLRNVVFKAKTTNPFPSVFAVLLVAIHEMVVGEKLMISDVTGVKTALQNLAERIDTSRKSTSSAERRKNIDTIKGLMRNCFVPADASRAIYGSHATTDLESLILRSQIELSDYELKQGLLKLDESRKPDENLIQKVLKTICAIANNGPQRAGKLIVGVADREEHAERIRQVDHVDPKRIGKRWVVGVAREAKVLGISMGDYVAIWKNRVKNSALSEPLRSDLLSNIDFNDYFGYGLLVFTVPPQGKLSYFEDRVYWRSADSTEEVTAPRSIADLASRF